MFFASGTGANDEKMNARPQFAGQKCVKKSNKRVNIFLKARHFDTLFLNFCQRQGQKGQNQPWSGPGGKPGTFFLSIQSRS